MCKKQSYVVSAAIVVAVVTMLYFPVTGTAGSLDPGTAPAPTMKTLDQIPPTWSLKLPANDGPDSCNSSRFKCVLDGAAVLDKETGLVWMKNPSSLGLGESRTWSNAHGQCGNRITGNRMGWRLPTATELATLIDTSQTNPSLPAGHPFTVTPGGITSGFWTATSGSYEPLLSSMAFFVSFAGNGLVNIGDKTQYFYIWCVRGGQGYDAY